LRPSLKDVACAITLQFLIRDDAVHAVVYMRSNDVILGLPYDVFLFTMLQEIISTQLGLKLGQYHHFCGSLHLYDRHIDLAERILATEDRSGTRCHLCNQ
jgi:thymidylate synthase